MNQTALPKRIPPQTQWQSLLLLLGLGALYFLLFGRFGYFPSDQGFIPSLAWRIWQGQRPYLDFIYVRPPLSAYLHVWEMALPASWRLLSGRIFFYLQMSLSTWWVLMSLAHSLPTYLAKKDLFWLAGLALIGALHNYSPMPWHTVDGIFLGSLGIYLMVVPRRWGWWLVGSLALLGAALCKQSFYLLPLIGWALIYFYRQESSKFFALGFSMGGSLVIAILTWLFNKEVVVAGLLQTRGASSLVDLWQTGIWQYLKALPALALGIALVEFGKEKSWFQWLKWLWPMMLIGGAGIHALWALWTQSYAGPMLVYGQILWLASLASAYLGLSQAYKQKQLRGSGFFPLLAFLGMAWSASISWGYATPILAFGPLVLGGWIGWQLWGDGNGFPQWTLAAITLGLALCWGLSSLYPYREAPRFSKYQSGGELFPALSGIQLGKESYERLAELETLAGKYGDRFTVLPTYPAAHLMLENNPPFASDWPQNGEINAKLLLPSLQTVLDFQVAYVFLQKNRMNRLEDTGRYGLLLGKEVVETWELIEEGIHLNVYRNPKLSEQDQPGLAWREHR